MRCGPIADRAVDLRGALDPPQIAGEGRILAEIIASDGVHQPLVNAVAVARDHHALAVFGRVGIGRNDVG